MPGAGDWELAISIMAINGFPVGGQFLINSILSDVIDYDEFLNGSRSEGSFSVFATLIPKFVSIPAGALPLAIIYVLDFRAPIDGVVDGHRHQLHPLLLHPAALRVRVPRVHDQDDLPH